jgi:hypothetical protein
MKTEETRGIIAILMARRKKIRLWYTALYVRVVTLLVCLFVCVVVCILFTIVLLVSSSLHLFIFHVSAHEYISPLSPVRHVFCLLGRKFKYCSRENKSTRHRTDARSKQNAHHVRERKVFDDKLRVVSKKCRFESFDIKNAVSECQCRIVLSIQQPFPTAIRLRAIYSD